MIHISIGLIQSLFVICFSIPSEVTKKNTINKNDLQDISNAFYFFPSLFVSKWIQSQTKNQNQNQTNTSKYLNLLYNVKGLSNAMRAFDMNLLIFIIYFEYQKNPKHSSSKKRICIIFNDKQNIRIYPINRIVNDIK